MRLLVTLAVAAPAWVDAFTCPLGSDSVTIVGTELRGVRINPQMPASPFVPITLNTWSSASNQVILVADGAPVTMTALQRRAALESDTLLGTGLLNPSASATAVSASFRTPVVNGPGPDMVFFEANATFPAEPFVLRINGITRTIGGAAFGDTGLSLVSHDVLGPSSAPTTITALLNNTLTRVNSAINHRIMGVAVDFSEFGIAQGASVTNFSFGSAGTSYVDPVFIAGVSGGLGIPYVPPTVTSLELMPSADTVRIGWRSVFGGRYAIQSSTVPGSWTNEVVNISGQGSSTFRNFINDLSGPPKSYQVVVYEPPAGTPVREILLRSSWQTENIGDIAHSPGVLQYLRNGIPEARLTLWATLVDRGVREMLLAEFPGLEIVTGTVNSSGVASNAALQNAWNRANIFIHGSGPSLIAKAEFDVWRRLAKKPYGFEGVTISSVTSADKTLLNGAAFVRCRDTTSLGIVNAAGVTSPIRKFGPDGTFALALRNEKAADAWLAANNLVPREYICVVPRLRWTPYWQTRGDPYNATRDAENQQFKEIDHAKLREAMIQWVRLTGKKVVACPEMTYEVALAKELLVDPLPADVKPFVVWKNSYWITDEAASVYAKAAAVVSIECHSPIMAYANGVPGIHLRTPTDTIKGQMYRDIGLPAWIMEIDQVTGQDVADRLMAIHNDPAGAAAYLRNGMQFVHDRQAESVSEIRTILGLPAQ